MQLLSKVVSKWKKKVSQRQWSLLEAMCQPDDFGWQDAARKRKNSPRQQFTGIDKIHSIQKSGFHLIILCFFKSSFRVKIVCAGRIQH